MDAPDGLAGRLAPADKAEKPRGWYPGFIAVGDTMDTMRQKILVVDDDPSLAEMLTIVLAW